VETSKTRKQEQERFSFNFFFFFILVATSNYHQRQSIEEHKRVVVMSVYESSIIDAPIEKVWSAVRDFGGVASWHPSE